MVVVRRAVLCVLLVLARSPSQVAAQSLFPGADEWASAVVEQTVPKWVGPTLPHPDPSPRPKATLTLRSWLRPLAVHAPADVSLATAERALAALEVAYDALLREGWPPPILDGGGGTTTELDLYLVEDELPPEARIDAYVPWLHLDAVTAFAVLGADQATDTFAACVTEAYAHALLLELDPAEAPNWRRATADYLARRVTGRACTDALARQQREPWRSWVHNGAHDGAGGGLLLSLLSEVHDGGDGSFVRDTWQLTRQLSFRWEEDLRAAPDLWMSIARAVELADDDIIEELVDFAAARWFSGTRRAPAPFRALRELPDGSEPPTTWTASWNTLPKHSPPHEPALESGGSAYALVDVSAAPPGSLLRVWLRGERGVHWSLVAVRLAEDGRERHRMAAPPSTKDSPRAYLPVELFDDTASVLLVVTNLSSRLPDADVPDENERSFRLIVDAEPGSGS